MRICKTCACRKDCRKGLNDEDFCLCWEPEPVEEKKNVLRRLAELVAMFPTTQEEVKANG